MSIDIELIRRRQSKNWGGETNRKHAEALMRDDIAELLEEVARLSWREYEHLDRLRKMLEVVEHAEDAVTHLEAHMGRMRDAANLIVTDCERAGTTDKVQLAHLNAWAEFS